MDIEQYIKTSINMYFSDTQNKVKKLNKELEDIYLPLIVVGIIAIISSLIGFTNRYLTGNLEQGLYSPSIYSQIGITIISSILGVLLLGFVGYGIIHLILLMFGSKATFKETVKIGLSVYILPSLLFIIINLIPLSLYQNASNIYMTMTIMLIIGIYAISIGIWQFVVLVRAFSQIHELSTGKVVLALLLPLIILLIIGIILFFVYMSMFL